MAYGSIKVDNIIFTNGGADETTTVSGIYKAITSGVTVSGTISGTTIQGQTISGATVTGTTIQGVSGTFTSLTGVTTTGTTANFVTHNGASGVFTTLVSGATVTGTTAQFTNITGVGIGATTITGTTVTGTTANFVSGVFTTRISGATVTGTTASFTSGVFTALSGTTTTVTSGIFGAGSATAPSVAVGTGTTYAPGIYSPGTDQVAISTNGVERVEFNTSEVVFNDGNNNYDFRIESDNNANLFFVDASVDRLGIGHASPATLVHIADTLAGSPVTTRIENFSSSANSDAVIELKTPNETYGLKANRSGARLDLDIGGTPKLSILTDGKVGLGTSAPGEKLSVAGGNISFDYGYSILSNGGYVQRKYLWSAYTTQDTLNFGVPGSYNGYGADATTARMTITQGGNVGIGTTSPDAALTVVGTGKFTATQSLIINGTSGTYSTWQHNGTAVGDIGTGNQVFSGGSTTDFGITARSATSLVFGTNTTERARIDSSGRLLVGTSSGNANGGILQLSSGITFPATAVAASDANTLDDYEEGTFTPTISLGITAITYTTQLGNYSKVGKLVYFNIRIVTSSGTTNGNQTQLSGLPFTPAATSFAATFYGPSAITTGIGQVQTSSIINLYQNASIINTANINGNNFTSGAVNIFVTGCYEV